MKNGRMRGRYSAMVLVASDKGSRGEREDATGPALKALLEEYGYVVTKTVIVPDERQELARHMKDMCDGTETALLVTAGGTGFSPRDHTPEATLDVAERMVPGLAEAMRAANVAVTPRAMLSRGVAAIRGKTLIVNLPGSPKGACENLSVILPVLGHGLDILRGNDGECART